MSDSLDTMEQLAKQIPTPYLRRHWLKKIKEARKEEQLYEKQIQRILDVKKCHQS